MPTRGHLVAAAGTPVVRPPGAQLLPRPHGGVRVGKRGGDGLGLGGILAVAAFGVGVTTALLVVI